MAKKLKRALSPPLTNMKPYSKGKDFPKMLTNDELTKQKHDRIISWVTFYRFNPSAFVEHYMQVKLYPYQRFWINLMSRSTEFVGIASRASAKSWIIGLYAMARCILYPGTVVALASSTKAQAGLIISQHCGSLIKEHPNIQREISKIVTNQNIWEVVFRNGSKINVVVSGESGRGHRSNITVLEERRLIPTEIIDSVIRPFLVSRQPPYMKNPKYSKIEELKEEPMEIIISSAYYKSAEWYPETKKFLKEIVKDSNSTKALFLDYPISIHHGIKTKKQMIREKETLDPITFNMEYGNLPFGESNTSFYRMSLFNRNIKRSWRPIQDETFVSGKKNIYDIPKNPGEYRIVSVDVAARAGARNDNTIIACARLTPSKKGWVTDFVYMESHNGMNTTIQALRIKQIYQEFLGDILVLDLANIGIGIFDSLSSTTKDEARGEEYPAYTVMNSNDVDDKVYNELYDRTLGRDAIGCIFPISATAQLNSIIAVKFKERLKRKLVNFLVDDNLEEEFLIKSGNNQDILDQTNSGARAYLLQAHLQTTLLINECIMLEMVLQNGQIKLVEPDGARKDRYSACSYLNYYASIMDVQLLKDFGEGSHEEDFLGVTFVF